MAVGGGEGAVSFEPHEVDRIERARLVLLGVPPSEISGLIDTDKWDILNIHAAEQRAKAQAQRNANQLAQMRGR